MRTNSEFSIAVTPV